MSDLINLILLEPTRIKVLQLMLSESIFHCNMNQAFVTVSIWVRHTEQHIHAANGFRTQVYILN